MEELKVVYSSLKTQIKSLQEQQSWVYGMMKLEAQIEGEASTTCPSLWDGEDHHLNHLRRCAYLRKHQDQCGHGVTHHAVGDNNIYGICADCGKILTEEDQDRFWGY